MLRRVRSATSVVRVEPRSVARWSPRATRVPSSTCSVDPHLAAAEPGVDRLDDEHGDGQPGDDAVGPGDEVGDRLLVGRDRRHRRDVGAVAEVLVEGAVDEQARLVVREAVLGHGVPSTGRSVRRAGRRDRASS